MAGLDITADNVGLLGQFFINNNHREELYNIITNFWGIGTIYGDSFFDGTCPYDC